MRFDELKSEFKEIGFESLRADSDDYFEGVILKDELPKVTDRLGSALGLPVWPSKEKLLPRVQQAIKEFGGIMPGQTLYFQAQGSSGALFAMLWPWQDGIHTTLKIVKK